MYGFITYSYIMICTVPGRLRPPDEEVAFVCSGTGAFSGTGSGTGSGSGSIYSVERK